jgi:hypothetical protein
MVKGLNEWVRIRVSEGRVERGSGFRIRIR